MFRLLGFLFALGAVGSAAGELFGLKLPTLAWGFELSRSVGGLRIALGEGQEPFLWFGWLTTVLAFVFGVYLFIRFWDEASLAPMTLRRIERFKRIKRGYYSWLVLLALIVLAGLDQVLVGSDALVVKYKGEWSFPAFTQDIEQGTKYGVTGDLAEAEPQYRGLKKSFREEDEGNWVMMPLWPYSPTNDNIPALASALEVKDGMVQDGKEGYSGLGSRLFDPEDPLGVHLQYKFRKGLKTGQAFGWDQKRNRVYGAKYAEGELVPGSETYSGELPLAEYLSASPEKLYHVDRPPSAPMLSPSAKHPLGTNSQGYDVLAYLYGGLKVNIQAAILYIPIVYLVGVTMGLLMGYFGGWFDLVVQRIIEVLSNIPFLFLVIIVSSSVPAQWKDSFGLYVILAILAVFGWMGMTYVMRAAALKERARDYVAAARVLGASTPRILFRHLLPNSVAIVVTLIPFSVSGLVLSLTALDYLGFGLPPKYATWGKLLQDGIGNLSSPWLVTCAFGALVFLLVLVTFVGEAVREAFDPKKFTYYR